MTDHTKVQNSCQLSFLSAISLYPTYSKTEHFHIFIISNTPSFILQILNVIGPWGRVGIFLILLRFGIQSTSDDKTSKSQVLLRQSFKMISKG